MLCRVIYTIHILIMPDYQTSITMQVLIIPLLTGIYHLPCVCGGLSGTRSPKIQYDPTQCYSDCFCRITLDGKPTGTTPGSWQSSLSSLSFSLSHLGADTGATDRNHSRVLAVLTLLPQLLVVTSWSGHRSNGPEPLLGPGSLHSPPSASRCHVLERTQEQRTGTTPGSWQSSLSSFSFPLSRLGADTGATDRNHSWVLAVFTLLLQLPVVTSWSGHRSNGPEPLLGPGSPHSPPSGSHCHVLERTLVHCAGLEFDPKPGPQLAVRVQARPKPAIIVQARPRPAN